MSKTATIPWGEFSEKHKRYIKSALKNRMCVAEGAIRSGKTIDHCIIAAAYLEETPDKFHLASGSTIGNAKLNIGVCNGFGLENLFRGRCHWGKYKDNEALYLDTRTGEKIVIFAGEQRQTLIKESWATLMVFGLPQKSTNTLTARIPESVLSRLQADGRLPHGNRSPFGI